MKTIFLRPTTDCGCTPETTALRGSYVDGPVVSAIFDLLERGPFERWEREVTKSRGGGWGTYLRRASREGMTVEAFEKPNFIEDWTDIDLSKDVRQGRQMSAGYRKTLEERGGAPKEWTPLRPAGCPKHWRRCLGTFVPEPGRVIAGTAAEKRLVAYISLIRSDDLLIWSQILGHSAWLNRGAMPRLVHALFAMTMGPQDKVVEQLRGIRYVLYGGFGDGQPGLKHWKNVVGFEAARLVTGG